MSLAKNPVNDFVEMKEVTPDAGIIDSIGKNDDAGKDDPQLTSSTISSGIPQLASLRPKHVERMEVRT